MNLQVIGIVLLTNQYAIIAVGSYEDKMYTEGQKFCMIHFYFFFVVVFEVINGICSRGILILRQRNLSKTVFAQVSLSQH